MGAIMLSQPANVKEQVEKAMAELEKLIDEIKSNPDEP